MFNFIFFLSIDFAGEKEEDHYLLMKKQKGNDNSTNTSEVIYKMNKIIEAEKCQIKPVKNNFFYKYCNCNILNLAIKATLPRYNIKVANILTIYN